MLDDKPGRVISPHSVEARERANNEEAIFHTWIEDRPYPSSSLPAQIASKCALSQGQGEFERFHDAIFRAFFKDCQDISDIAVLTILGVANGLDIEWFRTDFGNKLHETEVLNDFEEARSEFEGWGIPLVIFDSKFPLAGAVPIEMYHRAISLCLQAK